MNLIENGSRNIREGVQADIEAAFPGPFEPEPETPEGRGEPEPEDPRPGSQELGEQSGRPGASPEG